MTICFKGYSNLQAWLAGGPLSYPNKGFWCEIIQAGCPSWWQLAEKHHSSPFLHPLWLPKGKRRVTPLFVGSPTVRVPSKVLTSTC